MVRGGASTLAVALTICCAAMCSASGALRAAEPVDLSPARWPADDLQRCTQQMQLYGADKPLAEGSSGVVAGTTSPLAIRAGLEALKQGGTAADAVVATSLAQITLAGGAWVSYAGIYALVYFDAESGEVHCLNAGFNTVRAETDPSSIPLSEGPDARPSGRTAMVPGYMAGVEATHERFGKLPFDELLSPAIYFAEQGFEFTPLNEAQLMLRGEVLSRLPETKAIFTKADGTFYRRGEVFRQPALARTLRAVAEQGAAYMYTCRWAERMVEAVQRDGGKLALEDLKRYEPIWNAPARARVGEFEVCAPGPPAHGGVDLVEALNIMAAAGLPDMGDYRESAEAFFWLNQISDVAVLSHLEPSTLKAIFPGDPPTLAERMTPEHADNMWQRMRAGEFLLTKTPDSGGDRHSDAIVAVDRWGNVASVVHMINTNTWGATGIFVDGVSIPDAAGFQQNAIQTAGPGNRLADPMEPLVVLRSGRPVYALSSIGVGLHQKTLATLVNLLAAGRGLKPSVDAPSMHLPRHDATGAKTVLISEGDFAHQLLRDAKRMGLALDVLPAANRAVPRGYIVGAAMEPNTGLRQAVGSKFFNALPLGY